ncbi:glycerate kinase type-2 family protein [Tuwongella immobilis]|uniref:MOFRL domain-containing protein n=1 Tax=Tuwongella immobilis TaxID=692036 RepID=A0A6C2YQ47_9BACT|nr:DUF4147 domain-containing protein [Tuwongella immobilis]VIP03243.1 glycerate kinase : Putative uncharacterized protein OS=uncultured Desulfobacterium sp. GN=N47_E46250 PE=4 SV=1: DUF4147: MOFRL [Tuwongella immobilis]VTS03816.1 glycerate kinase : Putative uncharacterized protein OS=uncultured Desulfobacterium sp. GN=N47_E46250 PE=4 SV=1: DUF4147: MOFRL [Tuwongella immobilis]
MSARQDAIAIWNAGVDAVRPEVLLRDSLADESLGLTAALANAPRIHVVGAGKAGASMARALESALAPIAGDPLSRCHGLVNVPESQVIPLQRIRLHAARPAASNHPTAAGVIGSQLMLDQLASAGPDDVAICLISGGGSALLPAPADGISLEEKQTVTKLLHRCGATIVEMNTVRKHLSKIKGGQLATAFRGRLMVSLILSDVVGDPLDVIASGPTVVDPSTYVDSIAILQRYRIWDDCPPNVHRHLQRGMRGEIPETLKSPLPNVRTKVIGRNRIALNAAKVEAERRGYRVLDLGSFLEGETREVARVHAGILRSIRADGQPIAPPAVILSGGETTVTLGASPGKGGRNQAFVVAAACELKATELGTSAILSGGTDGEDGPTDAAGGVIDSEFWNRCQQHGLNPHDALRADDAYPLLAQTDCLLKTGMTETNVMDVRVIVIPETA